jgi:hypothetical protein
VSNGFFGLSVWSAAAEVWTDRRCRFLSPSSLFALRTADALSIFRFCLLVWIGQQILRHLQWLASRSNLEGGCAGAPAVGCDDRVHRRRAVLWRGGRSYLYFLFFLGCLLQRAGGAFVMLLFHLVNAVPLHKKIIFGISKSEEERGLLIFFVCIHVVFMDSCWFLDCCFFNDSCCFWAMLMSLLISSRDSQHFGRIIGH